MKKLVLILILTLVVAVGALNVWYHFLRPDPQPPEIHLRPVHEPEDPVRVTEVDPLEPELVPEDPERPREPEEPEELPDDEMITPKFIQDFAELVFYHYQPGPQDEEGRFTLTFKELNMHYATDLTGLRHQADEVMQAREEVFAHLLQPEVIDLVVRRYGPELVEHIVHLAENEPKEVVTQEEREERLLTPDETAELLELFAQRVQHLSDVFERTVKDEMVLRWVDDFMQTVEELNEVYFEYWQVEDEENDRREELAEKIKEYISEREDIRNRIEDQLADQEILEAGHDVVYEAQWIYRRVELGNFSQDSILALAEAGETLTGMAREKAEELRGD